jgi:hypothetical protein
MIQIRFMRPCADDDRDYLHPGVKGYQHLADSFPLGIFSEWRNGADEFV